MLAWLKITDSDKIVTWWRKNFDSGLYEDTERGVEVARTRDGDSWHARVAGRFWDDEGCSLVLHLSPGVHTPEAVRAFIDDMRASRDYYGSSDLVPPPRSTFPLPNYAILQAAGWLPVLPSEEGEIVRAPDGSVVESKDAQRARLRLRRARELAKPTFSAFSFGRIDDALRAALLRIDGVEDARVTTNPAGVAQDGLLPHTWHVEVVSSDTSELVAQNAMIASTIHRYSPVGFSFHGPLRVEIHDAEGRPTEVRFSRVVRARDGSLVESEDTQRAWFENSEAEAWREARRAAIEHINFHTFQTPPRWDFNRDSSALATARMRTALDTITQISPRDLNRVPSGVVRVQVHGSFSVAQEIEAEWGTACKHLDGARCQLAASGHTSTHERVFQTQSTRDALIKQAREIASNWPTHRFEIEVAED